MSQLCAPIANWANHVLVHVRNFVAGRARELQSPLLGLQLNKATKKLEKEQRSATKTRRQNRCPRNIV